MATAAIIADTIVKLFIVASFVDKVESGRCRDKRKDKRRDVELPLFHQWGDYRYGDNYFCHVEL